MSRKPLIRIPFYGERAFACIFRDDDRRWKLIRAIIGLPRRCAFESYPHFIMTRFFKVLLSRQDIHGFTRTSWITFDFTMLCRQHEKLARAFRGHKISWLRKPSGTYVGMSVERHTRHTGRPSAIVRNALHINAHPWTHKYFKRLLVTCRRKMYISCYSVEGVQEKKPWEDD